MNRTTIPIELQDKDRRPALRMGIILNNHGARYAVYHVVEHNPVSVEFKNAVSRNLDIACANKHLNAGERFAHNGYSAASSAFFLRRDAPPPAFASTGPKNLPV